MGGCTVKSTAWGRNRAFKWGRKNGAKNKGVKIKVFKNSVSFFVHLTFTIYSRIIPFPKFTKKMAWVSPVFPRADRPELLEY